MALMPLPFLLVMLVEGAVWFCAAAGTARREAPAPGEELMPPQLASTAGAHSNQGGQPM